MYYCSREGPPPACHRPLSSFKYVSVYSVESRGENYPRYMRLGFVDTKDDRGAGTLFFLSRLQVMRLWTSSAYISRTLRSDGRDVIETPNLIVTVTAFPSRVRLQLGGAQFADEGCTSMVLTQPEWCALSPHFQLFMDYLLPRFDVVQQDVGAGRWIYRPRLGARLLTVGPGLRRRACPRFPRIMLKLIVHVTRRAVLSELRNGCMRCRHPEEYEEGSSELHTTCLMTWEQGVQRFALSVQRALRANTAYTAALFNKVLEILRVAPATPSAIEKMLSCEYGRLGRYSPKQMRDHLIRVDANVCPGYKYCPLFDAAARLI
jgi:hypothetical protein